MGRSKIPRKLGYTPLPSQNLFHNSKALFRGFSGPVGSGKSQALCQEAVRMAYLNHGRLGLVAAPTYAMLRDITRPTLFEILEHADIPYSFNKAENLVELKDCDSKIILRSLSHPDRLRGTNLAWFGVDELTFAKQEAWERLEARLRDTKAKRRGGFAVWTPRGFDWVYQKFLSDPVADYQVILAQPFENCHVLDQVPNFYEHLKASYDETFYQQEVLGQYLNVGLGLVYHRFNRLEHVRDLSIDPYLPLFWSLDFNVDPLASVLTQHQGNECRVVDEIVIANATIEELALAFAERYPLHPAGIYIYGDSSGHARQLSGETEYAELRRRLHDLGYPSTVNFCAAHSNPAVRQRIDLINGKFRNCRGQTTLFIDPKCHELIKDFEQVVYEPNSRDINKKKDRSRTHSSDALGYVVWQQFHTEPVAGFRKERLF
jgi:hypothetical protein